MSFPQAVPTPPPDIVPGMHVQGGVMTFNLATIDTPDGQAIVLRIEASNGSFMFPLVPEYAIKLGSALREHGKRAASGLVVPQVLPPDGRLNGLS